MPLHWSWLALVCCSLASAAHSAAVSSLNRHAEPPMTASSPATACVTDSDCQLNGLCVSGGVCQCDAAWNGTNCEFLRLEPGRLAYAPPTSTAWGGGPPVLDEARNKWVIFVTEIANNCGLSEWQHMSTVVRAVSDNPAGPYTREALVVPPQAHNPYYAYDAASKTHLIFHIGGGDNPESKDNPFLHNCTNGTTPNVAVEGREGSPATVWGNDVSRRRRGTATVYSEQPYVHASKSLSGPFRRVNYTLPPGAASVSWGSDNPAPYVFPNGSILMLTRKYNGTRAKEHIKPHDTIWLVRAPSFEGPFELVYDRPVFEGESFDEEDPCIWRDARGHFHALFHFSHGHAWSEDGLVWTWGGGKAAWHTSVRLSDGTVQVWKDSERPRVWVNPESGQPELIFAASGINSQPTKRGLGEKGYLVVQAINTDK